MKARSAGRRSGDLYRQSPHRSDGRGVDLLPGRSGAGDCWAAACVADASVQAAACAGAAASTLRLVRTIVPDPIPAGAHGQGPAPRGSAWMSAGACTGPCPWSAMRAAAASEEAAAARVIARPIAPVDREERPGRCVRRPWLNSYSRTPARFPRASRQRSVTVVSGHERPPRPGEITTARASREGQSRHLRLLPHR
jgi:hypothetical protein